MSSKASLRNKNNLAEKEKQLDKRRQSIRVLVFPRKKYSRLVFVPVRVKLRQNTTFKIFADLKKYHRTLRQTLSPRAILHISHGTFSTRYVEMTVLKKDADQKVQDVLDIIFELEGKRRSAELE